MKTVMYNKKAKKEAKGGDRKAMDEFEGVQGNIDNIETLQMLKEALSKPVPGRAIKKTKKCLLITKKGMQILDLLMLLQMKILLQMNRKF